MSFQASVCLPQIPTVPQVYKHRVTTGRTLEDTCGFLENAADKGQKSTYIYYLSGPVLRDTARLSQRYPLLRAMGVFGVSTWPIGSDAPSPFSERSPLGEHVKWRYDTPPPPQRGISAIPARYPMKTRQKGAIPPSAIRSRKSIARYGGVSRTGPLRLP